MKKVLDFFVKVGDFVSTLLLLIFYFLIFGPIIFPIKLLTDFLRRKPKISNFVEKSKHYDSLESFFNEG